MKLEVTGLEALTKKFDKLSKDSQKEVNSALEEWADNVSTMAKILVPVDEGLLKNSINPQYGNGFASVTVASEYGAYIEFGTRKFAASYVASLPADWQSYAATFKGKGRGDYYDFLNAILDWVKRKGITARYSVKTKKRLKSSKADDERLLEAATAIAFQILKNGIKPQPYLYPSVNKYTPELLDNIKDIFKL